MIARISRALLRLLDACRISCNTRPRTSGRATKRARVFKTPLPHPILSNPPPSAVPYGTVVVVFRRNTFRPLKDRFRNSLDPENVPAATQSQFRYAYIFTYFDIVRFYENVSGNTPRWVAAAAIRNDVSETR